MDDWQAIRSGLVRGDPEAFEALYQRLGPRLEGYLLAMLRERDAAEEAIQELMLRLVRGRRRVAAATDIEGYVLRLARNAAIDLLRARRRRSRRQQRLELLELSAAPEAASAPPELEELDAALAALPDEQREVVHLKISAGCTFAEIAAATGVSLNTAASRYRYALRKLAALLGEHRRGA